jgi:hypothetical protein
MPNTFARASAWRKYTAMDSLSTGHIWHVHAVRVIGPAVFWVSSIPVITPPVTLLTVCWVVFTAFITYVAWISRVALATRLTDDGIELRGIVGVDSLKFSDVTWWWTSTIGGEPTLIVSRERGPLRPRFLIPVFDPELMHAMKRHAGDKRR